MFMRFFGALREGDQKMWRDRKGTIITAQRAGSVTADASFHNERKYQESNITK